MILRVKDLGWVVFHLEAPVMLPSRFANSVSLSFHFKWQPLADSGKAKTKFTPTQVRDLLNNPVLILATFFHIKENIRSFSVGKIRIFSWEPFQM